MITIKKNISSFLGMLKEKIIKYKKYVIALTIVIITLIMIMFLLNACSFKEVTIQENESCEGYEFCSYVNEMQSALVDFKDEMLVLKEKSLEKGNGGAIYQTNIKYELTLATENALLPFVEATGFNSDISISSADENDNLMSIFFRDIIVASSFARGKIDDKPVTIKVVEHDKKSRLIKIVVSQTRTIKIQEYFKY